MRATVMYGAGDVRIENVPDASLVEPTDALLRVTHACICGGDLWPYNQMQPNETGQRMGHEYIAVVNTIAGVGSKDAGAACGVVNVAHELAASLGLGFLVTVVAAPGDTLAHRVANSLTAGTGRCSRSRLL